jgi:hypothetical protein
MTSKRRTIVGSHPHRRTLPMGREALERALVQLRTFDCDSLGTAAALAQRGRRCPRWSRAGEWLPSGAHDTREELAAKLAEVRR